MKKYFLTAAFAVLAASPALAASTHHARNGAAMQGAYGSVDDSYAYAQPSAGAVVLDGKVIGSDPDAFIRQSLLKEGDHADSLSD
jgi:opacity protein-like surface antigen